MQSDGGEGQDYAGVEVLDSLAFRKKVALCKADPRSTMVLIYQIIDFTTCYFQLSLREAEKK